MKKYSKKIALILALALTLAIALPVLAAETNISGSYIGKDGVQVINVVVSGGSNVKAFLNPGGYPANVYMTGTDVNIKDSFDLWDWQNKYEIDEDGEYENNYKSVEDYYSKRTLGQLSASGDITTMPIVGVNLGTSKVKVKASVTSVVNGKFKFASSIPGKTANAGLVFLEVKATDYALDYDSDVYSNYFSSTDERRYDAFDGDALLTVLNGWNDKASWLKADIYGEGKTTFNNALKTLKKAEEKSGDALKENIIILKKGTATNKYQVCVMNAAKEEKVTIGKEEDGTVIQRNVVTPSYFVARLSGRISSDPKKKWDEADGFGASIIWSFETMPSEE